MFVIQGYVYHLILMISSLNRFLLIIVETEVLHHSSTFFPMSLYVLFFLFRGRLYTSKSTSIVVKLSKKYCILLKIKAKLHHVQISGN